MNHVTQIYSYGCTLRPTVWSGSRPTPTKELHETAEALIGQLLYDTLSRYTNPCIRNELAKRTEYRQIRSESETGISEREASIAALNEELDALKTQIKARSQQARTKVQSPELQARKREIIAQLSSERAQLKTLRAEHKAKLEVPDEELRRRMLADARAIGKDKLATHQAAESHLRNVETMVSEPQWSDAWKRTVTAELQASTATKTIRRSSGLGPGQYRLADRALEAMLKACAREGSDPRTRRFTGEGRIGVQIQGGLSVERLFGGQDNRLQIDRNPEFIQIRNGTMIPNTKRGATYARLRVGWDGQHRPLWLEFPVLLHRPIPPNAEIRDAWIHISRSGNRKLYKLQLTLRIPEVRPDLSNLPTLYINRGYRLMEDGTVRVAFGTASNGAEEDIRCSPAIIAKIRHAESLRAAADTYRDSCLSELVSYLASNSGPEWISEEWEDGSRKYGHIAQWRSSAKLARFAGRWRETLFGQNRKVQDLWAAWKTYRSVGTLRSGQTDKQDLFAPRAEYTTWLMTRGVTDATEQFVLWLDLWRTKNAHLYQMERDIDGSARRARKDAYRTLANQLRAKYGRIVVDDANHRELSAKPDASQEGTVHIRAIGGVRAAAAPSEFLEAITSKFGIDLTKADSTNITQECNECHVINVTESAALVRTCPHCGVSHDQDRNASRNLMHRERSGGSPELGTARNSEDLAAE